MNTKQMTQEQISAFADGELADQHVEIALAALRQRDRKVDWELYHQIGDVLRSDDMAISLSPGFAARVAQRLEAEPTLMAPVALAMPSIEPHVAAQAGARKQFQLWSLPNMVGAAAVAAIAFVTTPQLLMTMKGEPVGGITATTTAATAPAPLVVSREATPQAMPDLNPAVKPVAVAGKGAQPAAQSAVIAAQGPDGVVLRDARIDDYLWAHQRFSPSVYSSAQFARSATFATESSK